MPPFRVRDPRAASAGHRPGAFGPAPRRRPRRDHAARSHGHGSGRDSGARGKREAVRPGRGARQGSLAALIAAAAEVGPMAGKRNVVVGATEAESASSKEARHVARSSAPASGGSWRRQRTEAEQKPITDREKPAIGIAVSRCCLQLERTKETRDSGARRSPGRAGPVRLRRTISRARQAAAGSRPLPVPPRATPRGAPPCR